MTTKREHSVETERLLLKDISQEDLEPLSKLFADPDVMKSSLEGQPFPHEKSKKILHNMIDQRGKYGFSICAIIHKETGAWMGFCGLYWGEDHEELKTDFAYRFFKDFWGQGYATEAVKACLHHITRQLPDVVINAYIKPNNQPSLRVAEKAGMTFDKETTFHDIPVRLYQFKETNDES